MIFLKIYLCVYLFLAALGLRCCVGFSLVVASRGYSSLWCTGFSLRWLLLLWSTGSRCSGFSSCGTWAQQLWHAGSVVVARRLSSCGTWAQLLRGMWDLPGPGFEPVSPALAGGFLTTVPRWKPKLNDLRDLKIRSFCLQIYLLSSCYCSQHPRLYSLHQYHQCEVLMWSSQSTRSLGTDTHKHEVRKDLNADRGRNDIHSSHLALFSLAFSHS